MKKNNNESSNCNEKIRCDVESCKYNNNEENYCELDSIQVSCTCDECECDDCNETICASFECDEEKCGNITDNEYEVQSELDEDDEDDEEDEEEEDDD